MKESQLVQITSRRQLGERTYERLVEHLVGEMSKRIRKPQIAAMRLTGKVAENVVASPSGVVPDCQSCGACCAFYTCVAVERNDRVPRTHYWKINEHKGGSSSSTSAAAALRRRQMRRDPKTNNCIAFEGEVGKAVRCGIYNRRPVVCRNFEAGSDQCHAARRAFGLEPPLTEQQLAESLARLARREAQERRRERINGMGLVTVGRRTN